MFCPLLWWSIPGSVSWKISGRMLTRLFAQQTLLIHVAFGDQDLDNTPTPNPELFPKNCCLDPDHTWNLLRRRTWSDLKLLPPLWSQKGETHSKDSLPPVLGPPNLGVESGSWREGIYSGVLMVRLCSPQLLGIGFLRDPVSKLNHWHTSPAYLPDMGRDSKNVFAPISLVRTPSLHILHGPVRKKPRIAQSWNQCNKKQY